MAHCRTRATVYHGWLWPHDDFTDSPVKAPLHAIVSWHHSATLWAVCSCIVVWNHWILLEAAIDAPINNKISPAVPFLKSSIIQYVSVTWCCHELPQHKFHEHLGNEQHMNVVAHVGMGQTVKQTHWFSMGKGMEKWLYNLWGHGSWAGFWPSGIDFAWASRTKTHKMKCTRHFWKDELGQRDFAALKNIPACLPRGQNYLERRLPMGRVPFVRVLIALG